MSIKFNYLQFGGGVLEANRSHGCLVCRGNFDWRAEVAEVIHVHSTLCGAHHKPSAIWSKVNGCERRLHLLIAKDPVEMKQIESKHFFTKP